ncbi:hypothetical protein, partial [Shigella flexneri]
RALSEHKTLSVSWSHYPEHEDFAFDISDSHRQKLEEFSGV